MDRRESEDVRRLRAFIADFERRWAGYGASPRPAARDAGPTHYAASTGYAPTASMLDALGDARRRSPIDAFDHWRLQRRGLVDRQSRVTAKGLGRLMLRGGGHG